MTGQRGHGSYLFRQLIGLAAMAAVPLLLLLGFNIHRSAEHARVQALAVVDNQAIAVSHEVASLLQSIRQYLLYLAERPTVRAQDRLQCKPALTGVTQRRAHFANVLVIDAAGQVVCAASPRAAADAALSRLNQVAWFPQALRAAEVTISKPFVLNEQPGRPLVAVSQAIRDERGIRSGLVVVLLDLDSLQRAWLRYQMMPGARISSVADDGTLVVTNAEFREWVGKDVSGAVSRALQSNPSGQGLATGIDGVERAFARQPIDHWGWSVYATVPAAVALAEADAQRQRSLIIAAVTALLAGGLTLALARRITGPLRALTDAAHAVRQGDHTRRVAEDAPGEMGEVLAAFNAMLEAMQRSQDAVQASQRRYAELFSHIGLLSFMTNLQGRIIQVNRKMVDDLGWQRTELLSASVELLLPQGTDASDWFARSKLAAEDAGVTEQAVQTKSGAVRIVRWHHSLLRDADDAVVGIASIGDDVSEARSAATRERRQMDLYAALSRTNSAIVRVEDQASLLWDICRICVEHGHASIAYICLVVEGDVARPVAWAGPAASFLQGRDFPLDPAAPQAGGVRPTRSPRHAAPSSRTLRPILPPRPGASSAAPSARVRWPRSRSPAAAGWWGR